MLKKLKGLYALGVHDHLNVYELLRLQIVNRLSVLCVFLAFLLIAINSIIGNHVGIGLDLFILFFVIIPVLYLNHIRRYRFALYLFVFGYHVAVLLGCAHALWVDRVNEIELLLLPAAIGLTILLSGKGQVVFYLFNLVAFAIIKYFRWESYNVIPNDYYKLLAMVVITYIGIYYFVIQFKSQLLLALQNAEFLNSALLTNEKELKESNHAKDKLFSIIAHDLRSPLDLIKGLLDPAVILNLEKDELIKYQSTIRSRIAVLQETMNNLLNWAKSQLGKLEVNPVHVAVIQESKTIFDLFKEMIEAKQIEIQYVDIEDTVIIVDQNHFNVIMRNLIHNAIKFTPSEGRVTLSVKRDKDSVCIALTDSGAGIDVSTVDKILNSQLIESEVGTGGERGSGVGLSFCHELIKKNQGVLNISNSPTAGGTQIEITLPAVV